MAVLDRYWEAKKVTILGAVMNALLGCIKLVGGVIFHSHALTADGFHSFSDLITDIMVIFASKFGSLDADDSHPYGHQRIETAATFLLALLLILAGSGIAWDALYELIYGTSTKPAFLAVSIALFSIIINELLFHYTHHVGERIQSPLVIANAWHHRSDAAASLVVLVGLVGSMLGFIYLDAVAAIVVGGMIIKMGLDYGWNSIKELVDTALDAETVSTIEHLIQSVPGVLKIHQLRTRSMGTDIFIDVHILVEPSISVSEGHYIAQRVQHRLITDLERVKDVTVHVDPEDDEVACPSLHCLNRNQLEERFLAQLRNDYPQMAFYTLHYLDGKLIIDINLEKHFTAWSTLQSELMNLLAQHKEVMQFRLFALQEMIIINDK